MLALPNRFFSLIYVNGKEASMGKLAKSPQSERKKRTLQQKINGFLQIYIFRQFGFNISPNKTEFLSQCEHLSSIAC